VAETAPQAGAGAAALHALNVLLHGTNAFLTARVIEGFGTSRRWSVSGGLLMLTAPLAPEAVVWLSGIFDLSSTALVLIAVFVGRKYNGQPSAATRAQLLIVGLAAVASEETAVVAAGVVLVDAWARGRLSPQLRLDCGILLLIVGLFAAVRLATAFGASAPPFSRFLAQRALFGSFGALAVPWHVDVIERLPWVPVAGVTAVLALAARFLSDPQGSSRATMLALAGAGCVLLPIIPIFPILYVAPDLQQADTCTCRDSDG
jgi:hypothetical protein